MDETLEAQSTPSSLPCALRDSLGLFPIAPGERLNIYLTTCVQCGGAVRTVACIEEPAAFRAILAPFDKHGALEQVQ